MLRSNVNVRLVKGNLAFNKKQVEINRLIKKECVVLYKIVVLSTKPDIL